MLENFEHIAILASLCAIQSAYFGTGMKFRSKYFGPYKIILVKSNDRYNVEKVGGNESSNNISALADHVKLWHQD